MIFSTLKYSLDCSTAGERFGLTHRDLIYFSLFLSCFDLCFSFLFCPFFACERFQAIHILAGKIFVAYQFERIVISIFVKSFFFAFK